MKRTFLVELETNALQPSELHEMAADIQDSLLDDGFPVMSVKPWASPQQQNPMPAQEIF